jgi:enoyl-CoA hydratase/carnithine racemase
MPRPPSVRNYYQRFRGSHRPMHSSRSLPQPVIVAVHGYRFGAGLVAMLGDIRPALINMWAKRD